MTWQKLRKWLIARPLYLAVTLLLMLVLVVASIGFLLALGIKLLILAMMAFIIRGLLFGKFIGGSSKSK